MLNKRGSRIALRIGRPIGHARIRDFADARTATHYVRMCAELLGRDRTSGGRAEETARTHGPREPIIERGEKGAPVLLKQYLKLGGSLLGFNVDKDFSNALDGLILVDLLKTDPQVLQRYMGARASEAFRRHHAGEDYRRAS